MKKSRDNRRVAHCPYMRAILLDNLEERPYESGAGGIDRDRKNNNKRSGS